MLSQKALLVPLIILGFVAWLLGLAPAAAAPANDDIDNATVIPALPFTDGPVDTTTATMAPDDPDCVGNGPTVWYVFTPSEHQVVTANTFGSDYDTTLSIYTGVPGELSQIACNDDSSDTLQSAVGFNAIAGTTYFFMVGSFDSGPGGTLFFQAESSGGLLLVTTTADSGPGSLRRVILDANASDEVASVIVFNIPTTDPGFDGQVFIIRPTSPLPVIERPTILDGTSQTTFSGDSNPLGPEVVLTGDRLDTGSGLTISGDQNTITDLVIHGFPGNGIAVTFAVDQTPSRNQIRNNYLGTDPTGTTAVPNGGDGIGVHGFGSPEAQAQENVIEGNLIAGNDGVGVSLCDAAETRITSNRIGTAREGTSPLGNGGHGILLTCAGVPQSVIAENTIAFNGGDGVREAPDYRSEVALTPEGHQGNAIRRNAIMANAGLGINILPPPFGTEDGVTPNDPCDADEGGNRLQNFPTLTIAASDGRTTVVTGTLDSAPNQSFEIDLFANAAADPSGVGEGQIFLGTVIATTDASCHGTFTAGFFTETAVVSLTATATDPAGNTSEFSAALPVLASVPSCQGGTGHIRGRVTEAGTGLPGVTVTYLRVDDACQQTTTTQAFGIYAFPNLGDGTYIVLPSEAGCTFTPPSQTVVLTGGRARLDFEAICP